MILVCYGTRPEFLKITPLLEKMRGVIPFKTLFVGQHTDLVEEDSDYKVEIKEGENRLDSIISSVMNSFDFQKEGITHVMVQGDTATSFAVAVSAYHHKIPIIHLEAGMRTYDIENPYPEEFYRQSISKITNIHLVPTEHEEEFLLQEKCGGDVYVVGNTVLDNLVDVEPSYGKMVLITMHRRENHELLPEYFTELSKLAKENPELLFFFPLHPNPNVRKHRHLLENITSSEPLPYDLMVNAIAKCQFIITDSGGIQEEASFLKKKTIVCREKTERFVSLGKSSKYSSLLCKSPNQLQSIFDFVKNNYKVTGECPYGDGHSSEKIVEILKCVI